MRARFLCLGGLAAVFLSVDAQGAVQTIQGGLGQNPTSDYYADFNNVGLGVHYSFSGGVGTLSISNNLGGAKSGEGYTSQDLSAGTQGQGHPGTATAFTGFFTLNATISQVGSQWEIQSGNFAIQGNLFNAGSPTDLLLTGTLHTGANSFGFDSTQNELEFLFTTQSSYNGTQANQKILQDFFGAGAGNGAMLFNWGSSAIPAFSMTGTWFNSGNGFLDTFIPEPVCYPFAAAGIAALGLVATRRKLHA